MSKRKPAIADALAAALSTSMATASPNHTVTIRDRITNDGGDHMDATIENAIITFQVIEKAAEVIPVAGPPLKATCGIMVLILNAIKSCKENREGWRELAKIIDEKNRRVISLLKLYDQAPDKHQDILDQANRYQTILNKVANDITKETMGRKEGIKDLQSYWIKAKTLGREAALSSVNKKRIAEYRTQIQECTLNAIEVVGIQGALVIGDVDNAVKEILKLSKEQNHMKDPHSALRPILGPCPPLVEDFIGREDILTAMYRTHFDAAPSRRQTPIVTVLYGLGGSGKTQIALKFALKFKEKIPDTPVYFVNASSKESLEADLETLARSQSDVQTDALLLLAQQTSGWLLIMDNADDPTLNLASYLPRCSHGHIIVTTRNSTRRTLAPKSTHHVDRLSMNESVTLLINSSGYEDTEPHQCLAREIAGELGCLPLALSHAAAYILDNRCLDSYLTTYRRSYSKILDLQFELPQNYPHSVAATIRMSLNHLAPDAQNLMYVLSCLEVGSIPHSIIAKAGERKFCHVAWTTELPLNPKTTECAEKLMEVFCPSGEWISFDFEEVVKACRKYSLLKVASQDGERFYSMHVLVQTYLQSSSVTIGGFTPQQLATRLLASAVTYSSSYTYFAFNRLLFPHIKLVQLENVTEAGDHLGFGNVLEIGGEMLAVKHNKQCLEIWRNALGDDHLDTLMAMNNLAISLSYVGRVEEALPLQKEVLQRYQKQLGDDHLDTLMAMANLASFLQSLGQAEEALPLQKEVLQKYQKQLSDDHLDTLTAMNNLAISLQSLGRAEEALPLQKEVLQKRQMQIGDDHLDTLKAMSNFTNSLQSLGQAEEALPLQKEVLKKYQKQLGDDHLDTLMAMNNLASSLSSLGRAEEALPFQKEVLGKYQRRLGDDHLDTLKVINNLASSLRSLGRAEEALLLEKEVLEKRRMQLGDDHLDTLMAMNNLANSLSSLGRAKEALPLEKEVLEKRMTLLGEAHRDTLDSVWNLLLTQKKLGMAMEVEALARKALPLYEKVYGRDHEDTRWIREEANIR